MYGAACFTGDAVLGEGSVFIAPEPGALGGYLAGLERLRELDLAVLCPGHGPPVWDAAGKLTEYLAHRRDRERRLVEALAAGRRSVDELLDAGLGRRARRDASGRGDHACRASGQARGGGAAARGRAAPDVVTGPAALASGRAQVTRYAS